MNISRHAQERYATRLMGKDDIQDMKLFISNHVQKINDDINKMIEYGELLYEGQSNKSEWSKTIVQIYMRDTWVVIVDKDKQNVITLYSVDLGVGDEMNELYISKIRQQLDEAKAVYSAKSDEIDKDLADYQQIIDENMEVIYDNNRVNKALEEQNELYYKLIENKQVDKELAAKEVRRIINILTSKSVF